MAPKKDCGRLKKESRCTNEEQKIFAGEEDFLIELETIGEVR